jgi:hypothetical protein
MTITPMTMVDDDGSGTTGTVWNATYQLAFEANINAAFAAIGSAPAIGVVSTDGFVLSNPTLATAGVPVQWSPRLRFRGNVWNTTAVAASNTTDWWAEVVPTSGASPTSILRFSYSANGGAAVSPFNFASTGLITATGYATQGGNYQAAAGDFIYWSGRTIMTAPAAGQWNVTDIGATLGVGFDLNVDGVLKVRTRAQTAYATVDALGYKVSGVAGVSFSGAVATLTVVNGIVTGHT